MTTHLPMPWIPVLSLFLLTGATAAQVADQPLWSTPWSNYTTVPSCTWTGPALDTEAADDFDVHGTITRVRFDADGCFNCQPPVVTSATVRFYAWNNGSPGALQYETTVPTNSTWLEYNPTNPTSAEVRLPTPFLATGLHFVSMQLHFQGTGSWRVWSSSVDHPTLAWSKIRNNLTGGVWTTPPVNEAIQTPLFCDLTFALYGVPAGGAAPVPTPCRSWTEMPTVIPPATSHTVWRGVKAFAADDAWAVGEMRLAGTGVAGSLTVTMHWNGSSWDEVPSPNPGGAGSPNTLLHAVDGVATNDLWAAGLWTTQTAGGWTGPQVFAMHWDGTAWIPAPNLPLPNNSVGAGVTGSRVLAVKAIASNDVWFAGFWIDVISSASGLTTRPGLLMHWDGSSLQLNIVPIVSGQPDQFFQAVDASGPNDVWAVGGAGNLFGSGTATVPVVMHFDGSSWTHRPCLTPSLPGSRVHLHDVHALAPNDVYVFGTMSTSAAGQVQNFLSHWNGSSWTLLPPPPAYGKAAVLSASDIWLAEARVWHWDGVAWSVAQEFPAADGPSLTAIDALGPCELVAVGTKTRIGQRTPFAARIDAPSYWRTAERLPTVPARAAGALRALTPPRVGTPLWVEASDPGASLLAANAISLWILSSGPAAGYPFAAPLPFGGVGGSVGELFLDPLAILHVAAPVLLVPGISPALHSVALPPNSALIGWDLFTQALLIDAADFGNGIVSNGLDLHLGG